MQNLNQVNISLNTIGSKQGSIADDSFESSNLGIRKISSFNLQNNKQEIHARPVPGSMYLLFPIVLILWPFVRICYSTRLSNGFIMACHSLFVIVCILKHIVPTIFCVSFYIIYCGTVYTEYSFFLSLPYEGFRQTVKKTVSFYEKLIPPQVAEKTVWKNYRWRCLSLMGLLSPLLISFVLIVFVFANDDLLYDDLADNINNKNSGFLEIQENYKFYQKFKQSDDFKGGFLANPGFYSGAFFAQFILMVFKSHEIGEFYRTIYYELTQVEVELNKSIDKYDYLRMYETGIYLKNATRKWTYIIKAFMIKDFVQTFSLFSFILLAAIIVYSEINSISLAFNPYLDDNLAALGLTSLTFIIFGVSMFIWKLSVCYSINSFVEQVETKFADIKNQLSYTSKGPLLFIQILRNDQVIEPDRNDMIKWTEIIFNQRNYNRLFDNDRENFITPLLGSIQKKEQISTISYKDAEKLIAESASSAIESLDLIKKAYDDLYRTVEYKLFGFLVIDKGLLVKVIGLAITSLVTYLYNNLGKILALISSKSADDQNNDDQAQEAVDS